MVVSRDKGVNLCWKSRIEKGTPHEPGPDRADHHPRDRPGAVRQHTTPKLARSMGQASKEFKKGVNEGDKATDEDKPEKEDSA